MCLLCSACIRAYAGKKHEIRPFYFFGVTGKARAPSESGKRVHYGMNIACVIVYNRNHIFIVSHTKTRRQSVDVNFRA